VEGFGVGVRQVAQLTLLRFGVGVGRAEGDLETVLSHPHEVPEFKPVADMHGFDLGHKGAVDAVSATVSSPSQTSVRCSAASIAGVTVKVQA